MLNILFCTIIAIISPCMTSGKDSFDYITFNQQWPPSICYEPSKMSCNIPKFMENWGIHGLWPTSKSGKNPEDCKKVAFNFNEIKPLLPQLEKVWPTVMAHETDQGFWKHEWTKHGTCALSLPETDGELKYFTMALELYKNYSIFNLLEMKGITPSLNTTYKKEDIESILDKKIKLTCSETSEYSFLTAINICLDKKFQLMDCPSSGSACSDHPILYVPYKSKGHSNFYYFAVLLISLAFIALLIAIAWMIVRHFRSSTQTDYSNFN